MILEENSIFASRYRLIQKLGQGGFSEVWKAEDIKAGNIEVAIKIYAPEKGMDTDGISIFSTEYSIVFEVNHQNLLRANHFDVFDNSPYLVMTYCPNGSSLKLAGSIKERELMNFLFQASSALGALHDHEPPIIHQDIKPDNFLIDRSGKYVLTDFGISTRVRSTLRKSVGLANAGTLAYMAPERFSKDPTAIKASDVFSLGVTLYELVTGDVPFGDHGGLVLKGGGDIPDLPQWLDSRVATIIQKCLSPNPWDRPTASALKDMASAYLSSGNEARKTKIKNEEIDEYSRVKELEKEVFPSSNNSKRLVGYYLTIAVAIAVMLLGVVTGVYRYNTTEYYELMTNQTITVKGVSFDMIAVEGGTFQMGDTYGGGESDEKPIHSVTLSDYCIGKTEVTQALWEAVMGSNPSGNKGSTLPVERVSWNACQEFIRKLNAATGKTFRLPTEAEWEYAAKGGNKSKGYQYSGSNDINSVAWYGSNSGSTTHVVGTKQSNELGLYDMSGNVWEWCSDWYGAYSSNAQRNPTGATRGSRRVSRGGGWYRSAEDCRVACRNLSNPEDSYYNVGLRLVFVP